jgi:curli biogenesis system outer membrane secretion channel CsgG
VSDASIAKAGLVSWRPLRAAAAFLLFGALSACDANLTAFEALDSPMAPLVGPPVTRNTTPIDPAFTCMASRIKQTGRNGLRIGVGEVLDLTGKYVEAEGGGIVTKGGAHMVMSALGKLDDSIVLVERVSTEIADRELAYMDRRQLGDGGQHEVPGEAGLVPWLPYFGGTVLKSDYYIVGAITELNFNISSGGGEVTLSGFGVRKSRLTMNVAIDLRIVDTQSLEVVGTTSLQKQIVGEEIGADVFRFFGDYLFDLNTGRRAQEPVQLAVRTTLELAVLEMIGEVTRTDDAPCVAVAEAAMIDSISAARVDPVVGPPAVQARRAVGRRT